MYFLSLNVFGKDTFMALSTPLKKQPLVKKQETVYYVLFVIGICHLLNDSLQAVIPAMFPILEL